MESHGESAESFAQISVDGIASNLSVRQWHVAKLAAHGYSNREIASELKLTEQIVKNVLHSVFDKLGVWNRVELANRFPKGVEPGIALESQRRIKSERVEELLQRKTLDTKAEAVCDKLTEVADTGMELRDLLTDAEFPLRGRWVDELTPRTLTEIWPVFSPRILT